MKQSEPKLLRCAIYTRVSTDHGLEQEFNSLDAQREAAQAYVKSQTHEGWKLVRERYDDGGFSGGSMERPALQKLLAAIRDRKIDVVVVYKVDRLTRSLTDFAKLVELFDAHAVSFVSVTQSFNTTSSMGRLTLNVLLSFAQFEREVTGERIRDKIAASKKKGIWVGGVVPLGYQVTDRKLVVDSGEAATVRLIFERYLALGSLPALQRELRDRGIVTRKRILASGRNSGGVSLTNGPLAYLLRNRVYLGDLNHRGQSYPGEHQAIIDPGRFDAVQAKLTENLRGHRLRRQSSDALLLGRIFDDRGHRMSPSYAIKKGVRYRYYVSCVLAQGRKAEAGSVSRVGASTIEAIVIDALASVQPEENQEPMTQRERVEHLLDRVTLGSRAVDIRLNPGIALPNQPDILSVPWSPVAFRRRRDVIQPAGSDHNTRPIRAESRTKLLDAIAKARAWLAEIMSGQTIDIETIARRDGVGARAARMCLSLAFLAPDIVQAAALGTLPRGFGVSRLTDLPFDWAEQRKVLGLPPRP